MQALAGIGPEEILFVGESPSDLEAVHRNKTNPAAIFCFQEQGARDICATTTGINARLRSTHASLGADAVNSRLEDYGIGDDIIRLELSDNAPGLRVTLGFAELAASKAPPAAPADAVVAQQQAAE